MRSPAIETIAALSSGALPSGVAVVRLSGRQARAALERLAGAVPPGRRASLRTLRDASGAPLDRALVLFFPAPATVTGEDVAELHLHGGRAVVAGVLDALVAMPGLRLAEAGEFTRRAFSNGRIDLTGAEGLADLLAAETAAQRTQALAQSGGALRALYEGWAAQLTRLRALIEASFDFADEGDVGTDVAAPVRAGAARLAREIAAHLGDARRGEIFREGFRVALVGAPNAGKSSLLNRLADREAAIVTAVPGTTRDVIEVRLDLAGLPVRLFDTAGLRDTDDAVERIGIARARAAMADADLMLALDAPDAPLPPALAAEFLPAEEERVRPAALRVAAKADVRDRAAVADGLAVSATTGEGVADLVARIAAAAHAAVGNPNDLVPTRTRHRDALAAAQRHLADFADLEEPAEVAAEHLRLAVDALGRLTGRTDVEDLLDVVFSEFCIGK